MTQHTPGPWVLESVPDLEDGENIEIYDQDGFPIAKIEGEPIISNWSTRFPEMEHWSEGKEDGRTVKERSAAEIMANARLFLAAPELLATCEALAAFARDLLKLVTPEQIKAARLTTRMVKLNDKAFTVMAKAKGEL